MTPTTVEGLSAAWLGQVLREGGHLQGEVSALAVESLGERRGFASDLYRLRPSYAGAAGPHTLIAKIPPAASSVREIVAAFGFFPREVRFFRELSARVPVATPRCFFGGLDAGGQLGVLLLEDLGGLRAGSQQLGCEPPQARAAIGAAGKLHGRFRDDAELSALPWLTGDLVLRYQGAAALFRARSEGFVTLMGERAPARFIASMPRLADFIAARGQHAHGPGATLVHGDFRLDNLMFPAGDDAEPVLLDWQLASWGPGAADVAYFISQSLSVEQRRAQETALLTHYLQTLEEGGVGDYRRQALEDDYRRGLLAAALIVVNLSGTVLDNRRRADGRGAEAEQAREVLPGLEALLETMTARALGAIEDADALAML